MKEFPKLNELTDDELISLVFDGNDDWQKEAIDYAKQILYKRGVTDDYAQKRILIIRRDIENLWQNELEDRKNESYGIIELILIVLFWYKHIFSDWYLRKDGYLKKHKQRLYSLGSGIVIYSIFMICAFLSYDKTEKNKIDELNSLAKIDSVVTSQIDWSGQYIFVDSSSIPSEEIIWQLYLKRDETEHIGKLTLTQNNKTLTISCIGLIIKKNIEMYPDTNYTLFNGQGISYYDRLFTFVRESDSIITIWGKMEPLNYRNIFKGFYKKSNSS